MALLSFSGTWCVEMNGSIMTTSIWLSRMVWISASTTGTAIVVPFRFWVAMTTLELGSRPLLMNSQPSISAAVMP